MKLRFKVAAGRQARRSVVGAGTQRTLLAVPLVAALGLLACSEGSDEKSSSGEAACDVPALLADSCGTSRCHGGPQTQSKLDLTSPGVESRLFQVAAAHDDDCADEILAVGGDPSRSYLYKKLTEDAPRCGDPMPKSGRLSDSELACVRQYIADGPIPPSCETCGGILCVDFEADESNCGKCGEACAVGLLCAAGECINPCQDGETLCGSECVVLSGASEHCGRCGHRCAPGSTCEAGACACEPGLSAAFAADVLPIFEASCGTVDCHEDPAEFSSLILDPDQAHMNLVSAVSGECKERTLVVPMSADQSYLLDKLMGGDICDGDRMPLLDDPLPDAQIKAITSWICAGAKND